MNAEMRVLLYTPTGRDAELLSNVLRDSHIGCVLSNSWPMLLAQIDAGAAALIIAEEALEPSGILGLSLSLGRQPAWSDLPVLLLTARGADSLAIQTAALQLGNVTLLERPTRVGALVSAARAALRSRSRQYQSRAQLVKLESAAVELNESHRLLAEANARKDEFLATLAHELRNPLAPIRNIIHILRRQNGDARIAPMHDILDRQVTQLVRLVDDLLELSRISRGMIELRVERLDIAAVIHSAIETSRPLIDASRHQLVVKLPPGPVYVRADAVRLGQVFANLLNNAAKYTEEGGVITVCAASAGKQVMVSVEDTGVGIASEMLDSIFTMFTQIHHSNDRAQGGLGIGLTLVKRLLEMHGGRIEALSAGAGQGSTFKVFLEQSDEPAVAHEIRGEAAPDAPLLPPVFLVDDNRDAADTLAMALRGHGADVKTLYNGPDVLESLPPNSHAVVIADVGMPHMDGHELARRIRSDPANAGVTLVALSGWGQEADRANAKAAGFEAHMIKPANIDALVTLLTSFATR